VHTHAWFMKLTSHARGIIQPVALTPYTSGASHSAGTDAVFKFWPTLVVHPTLVVLTPPTSPQFLQCQPIMCLVVVLNWRCSKRCVENNTLCYARRISPLSDDTLRQWFLTVSMPRLPQSNCPFLCSKPPDIK